MISNNLKESLKELIQKTRSVVGPLVMDKQTKRFITHNKRVWNGWNNSDSSCIILADFYGVAETNIARSYFLNILARKHNAAIKTFETGLGNRTLHQIYRSFNTSGHIAISLNEEQERRKKHIVEETIPVVKTKQDVFNLTISNVWIGIDIYESYLRTYKKPTIYLDDPNLWKTVEQGIGLVVFWQDFFKKNKVVAIVVSHDCYLRFNVVNKVAYINNVPVYFPNPVGIHCGRKPHSIHAHYVNFRQMFKKLSNEDKRSGLALAKKQLERRFSGEVGVDMPYSTQSAFHSSMSKKRVLKENDKIKVLITTHCFYDNPHGYGKILFVDFYEWLIYLGEISTKTEYDWYLKTHPDPLPGTYEIIDEILARFPTITLIPQDISHHQLAKEGINFVLTVYGTVGHEYPALGVQVINAGYNPRIAYDLNWHPKSLDEYEYYLLNLDKLHVHIELDELYEFYYMFYYYVCADNLIFNSYKQFLSDINRVERIGPAAYNYFLNQLTEEKHQAIINKMQVYIDSGKSNYFIHGSE